MTEALEDAESALIEDIAAFADDPLGFVLYSFPWGEPGTELEPASGPRQWQREKLEEIGEACRSGLSWQEAFLMAIASGHGIGKSAFLSMVLLWAMATREDTRGVVTANTASQLATKTWPELAKWHRLCIVRHWFECTATSLYSNEPGHEKNWRIDAIPWSETNTEAFAGLHNEGKRIIVVFDEGSAISDKIYEVTEGALTDANTEIFWLVFGNPTRNTGRFFEAFNRLKHRWRPRQIDSRTVEGTNKEQLERWIADYGLDSDFVKVRVRGIFPQSSALQFIDRGRVDGARARVMETVRYAGRTAAIGVDVARFGDDQSCITTRLGRDARSIPPKTFRGLDTMSLVSKITEHLREMRHLGLRWVLFVDGGGVGGGVIDRLRQLNYDVVEVQFGGDAMDKKKYANRRAEMWGRMKEWLLIGAIVDQEELSTDLTSVEYGFNKNDQILLESKKDMKKRGLASPDVGDGLAITFAEDVPEWSDLDDLPAGSSARQQHDARGHDPYADLVTRQAGRADAEKRGRFLRCVRASQRSHASLLRQLSPARFRHPGRPGLRGNRRAAWAMGRDHVAPGLPGIRSPCHRIHLSAGPR